MDQSSCFEIFEWRKQWSQNDLRRKNERSKRCLLSENHRWSMTDCFSLQNDRWVTEQEIDSQTLTQEMWSSIRKTKKFENLKRWFLEKTTLQRSLKEITNYFLPLESILTRSDEDRERRSSSETKRDQRWLRRKIKFNN